MEDLGTAITDGYLSVVASESKRTAEFFVVQLPVINRNWVRLFRFLSQIGNQSDLAIVLTFDIRNPAKDGSDKCDQDQEGSKAKPEESLH